MTANWTPLDLKDAEAKRHDTDRAKITHRPDHNPDYSWEVWIPPTRAEHFEGFEAGDTADIDEFKDALIRSPWGTTYWPTLEEASTFLAHCFAAGEVVPRRTEEEARRPRAERIAAPADPEWKVGDPDPTPTFPYGGYCDEVAPEVAPGERWTGTWAPGHTCTWAPGHTEAQHVSGNGEKILAVWDVDDPTDPAPQGDPITSTTD